MNRVEENFTIELSCTEVRGWMKQNSKAARLWTLKIMDIYCEMRDHNAFCKTNAKLRNFKNWKWTTEYAVLGDNNFRE